MIKKLTVFTPTYNRADLLVRGYEALLKQTREDFVWLIVDDGSTDDTQNIIEGWQKDAKIQIHYYYKENGGLHTAYNLGIEKAESELFICIDSDDYLPENGVALIVDFWEKYGSEKYGGLIGQDFYLNGTSVGGDLPSVASLTILDLTSKYGYVGDVKMVHRTKLLKQVAPMPVFNNEKNFNPIYLFLKIDQNYPLLVLNENLCFVDYQPDGMANNILQQFVNSPNSFAELRLLNMSMPGASLPFIFRNAIHYVSSCIIARRRNWLEKSPHKVLTLLAVPFGISLSLYLKFKNPSE